MKMLAEYLDNAIKFEQLAAAEKNPALRAELERQAAAYRKLAEERAKQYGYPMPDDSRQKSAKEAGLAPKPDEHQGAEKRPCNKR